MFEEILFAGTPVLAFLLCIIARQRSKRFHLREEVFALVTMGRASIAVTHDLNNLLHIIGANVEFIRRANAPEEIHSRVNNLEDAFICASRLTRHALSLIRGQEQQPERVDLPAHLKDLEAVLQTLAGNSTDLAFNYHAQNLGVWIRRSYLDQILINLVVNSREAGSSRVEIRLAERNSPTLRWKQRPVDTLACLEIADNGKGLSKSALKFVTQEFFTSDKAEGTGIGLATVERIVKRSGGQFAIQNYANGGAIATIELPKLAEAA